jgi:hypothetical protein
MRLVVYHLARGILSMAVCWGSGGLIPTEAVEDDDGTTPMIPVPPGTPDGGGADLNCHAT